MTASAVLSLVLLLCSCSKEPRPLSSSPPIPSASAPPPDASSAPAPAPPPEITSTWCIEGLRALDEETCYLLPALAKDKPRRLLVYLHGVVPPMPESAQQKTVQNAVKNAATRAGAAAI